MIYQHSVLVALLLFVDVLVPNSLMLKLLQLVSSVWVPVAVAVAVKVVADEPTV